MRASIGISGCATKHPLYRTWDNMVRRCHHPNHSKFSYYGARGVSVCHSWRENFWNFVRDMGERPVGTTLDRINPSAAYEPSNCRWADSAIQAANRNRRPGSASKFKGVFLDRRSGLWYSKINVRGKRFFLGSFHSEEIAANAYDKACIERWGGFVSTNHSLGLLAEGVK